MKTVLHVPKRLLLPPSHRRKHRQPSRPLERPRDLHPSHRRNPPRLILARARYHPLHHVELIAPSSESRLPGGRLTEQHRQTPPPKHLIVEIPIRALIPRVQHQTQILTDRIVVRHRIVRIPVHPIRREELPLMLQILLDERLMIRDPLGALQHLSHHSVEVDIPRMLCPPHRPIRLLRIERPQPLAPSSRTLRRHPIPQKPISHHQIPREEIRRRRIPLRCATQILRRPIHRPRRRSNQIQTSSRTDQNRDRRHEPRRRRSRLLLAIWVNYPTLFIHPRRSRPRNGLS